MGCTVGRELPHSRVNGVHLGVVSAGVSPLSRRNALRTSRLEEIQKDAENLSLTECEVSKVILIFLDPDKDRGVQRGGLHTINRDDRKMIANEW